MDITKEELEKKFKRFKKRYFKNHKDGFTGEELAECKEKFLKKYKIKL